MKLVTILAGSASWAEAWSLRRSSTWKPREQVNTTELEHMLLGMASIKGKTGTKAVGEFLSSLNPIMTELETEINASHVVALATVSNMTSAISSCSATQANTEATAAQYQSATTIADTAHKTCRVTEAADAGNHQTCENELAALISARDASCDAHAELDILANLNQLPAPNSEEYRRDYLPRLKIYVDNAIALLASRSSTCSSYTVQVTQKTSLCGGTDGTGGMQGTYTTQKATCDAAQTLLETTTCNYADSVQDACDSFDLCYNLTKTQYDNQVPNLQAEEASRKREWWMIQRVRCYLGVLEDAGDTNVDETAMTACQTGDHDTNFLDLVYPTLPPAPHNCATVVAPCEATYISNSYSSLPATAPAKACTPCVAPTTTMTTTTTLALWQEGLNVPNTWPKVVGQGSYYSLPKDVKTLGPDGSCNGVGAWPAYNMLYDCSVTHNDDNMGWLGEPCHQLNNCPDRLWFTFDLGAVYTINKIAVWPAGHSAFFSSTYEILVSSTHAGPAGTYSDDGDKPAFSETSQGFTQVVHNVCGGECWQEFEHELSGGVTGRYMMFHAIDWNSNLNKEHSAGVRYIKFDVDDQGWLGHVSLTR